MQETWAQSLGWEDSPGGGHGNPLQYSCPENPVDRESWWAVVHRIAKSQIQLRQLNTHAYLSIQYHFHSRCMGVYVCVQSLSRNRVSVGRWKIWEMDDGESCSTIYLYIEPLEMYSVFSRWVMSDSFVTHGLHAAHQASLSMELPVQEYGSGLPFPSPRGSSWPTDQTSISCVGRQILYHCAT